MAIEDLINYKEKAYQYLTDWYYKKYPEEDCFVPHLEDWLGAIESTARLGDPFKEVVFYMGAQIEFVFKDGNAVMFDLSTGQPSTREDYLALCKVLKVWN